jgi:hypothetical protein
MKKTPDVFKDSIMCEHFRAYQHFLYWANMEHLKETNPWKDSENPRILEHFIEKLNGIRNRRNEGQFISIQSFVNWVQEMSHHYQDDLFAYINKYHHKKW